MWAPRSDNESYPLSSHSIARAAQRPHAVLVGCAPRRSPACRVAGTSNDTGTSLSFSSSVSLQVPVSHSARTPSLSAVLQGAVQPVGSRPGRLTRPRGSCRAYRVWRPDRLHRARPWSTSRATLSGRQAKLGPAYGAWGSGRTSRATLSGRQTELGPAYGVAGPDRLGKGSLIRLGEMQAAGLHGGRHPYTAAGEMQAAKLHGGRHPYTAAGEMQAARLHGGRHPQDRDAGGSTMKRPAGSPTRWPASSRRLSVQAVYLALLGKSPLIRLGETACISVQAVPLHLSAGSTSPCSARAP
jgi:hypothetical protein